MSVLATKTPEMQTAVRNAPLLPGCYLYKDKKGKVIYVGKAKVLRNRVKSYFSNFDRVEEKIRQMVTIANSIDFVTTDSEIEALILENVLIKKYKPKYNSMYVDDKSYAYVHFPKIKANRSGEKIVMPTITVTREKHTDEGEYFGPYPDTRSIKRLLGRLRRIYPYCTSKTRVVVPNKRDGYFTGNTKPCFHYQINLCNGACAGLATRGEYERNLNNIKTFFKGEKHKLQTELESQMQQASKRHEYEAAAKYRNMLNDIKYAGSNLRIDRDIDELLLIKEKKARKQRAIEDLIVKLAFPKDKLSNHKDFRIECYDISNIQGTNAVGSMVVSLDGEVTPPEYRRFKIRMKNEPNDFAMMQEMLARRFAQYLKAARNIDQIDHVDQFDQQSSANNMLNVADGTTYTNNEGFTVEIPKDLKSRLKNWTPDPSFSKLPDLIIIDGGKGQLSSAYKILCQFGLDQQVPIVGLAKREEEIFGVAHQFDLNNNGGDQTEIEFTRVLLPRRSEALYAVQRIRDEAHRFAITYHRKLRSKAALT